MYGLSNQDVLMFALLIGVVVITAIALFWPKKKTYKLDGVAPGTPLVSRGSTRGPAKGFVGPSGRKYLTDRDIDMGGDDEPLIDPVSGIMAMQAILNPGSGLPVVFPHHTEDRPQEPVEKASTFQHHEAGSQVVEEKSSTFHHHEAGSQVTESHSHTESHATHAASPSSASSESPSSCGGGGGGE
jgi:hypothetical protein